MMKLRKPRVAVPVDIAPLIDMVFLLLLFFMLSSSFVTPQGIKVTLPEAGSSKSSPASQLTISVTKDHLIYLNDELVTLEELESRLDQSDATVPVVIRADKHAYVDRLIELWDLCRTSGFNKVHIGTVSSP